MAMARWRPFGSSTSQWEGGLGEIQTEMNKLFDAFFGRPTTGYAGQERMWAPVVDLHETKDELVVACDLPGVPDKDVHVSITGDVLTIRGERLLPTDQAKDESYHRLERWYGKFERHVQLPMAVQSDKVKASYRDGVLEVRLPKVEEIKPKEIKINLL
jgi:HSP20 family protein